MKSIALLALGLAASLAGAAPTPSTDAATEFALVYGYPLIPYAKFALPVISGVGTNRLQHMRQLSTADFQDVVRPNVDTLYSLAIIDLSHSDLVIEIPNITDRYWVFPFYDVYGNNYANIGSVGGNKPGKYRVRYANDVGLEPGVQLCDNEKLDKTRHDSDCQEYQGYVNAPTPYGTFVGRLLLRDNGADLQRVHLIQNQTGLYEAARGQHRTRSHTPKLTTGLLNASLSTDIPTRIMEMTARIVPFNPPRDISDLPRVNRLLRKAGIKNGRYIPTHSNLTALADQAAVDVSTHATNSENLINLGNGWSQTSSTIQGDFGTDYKMRYYTAFRGYLALTATEALYPYYRDPSSGSGTLTLESDQSYILTYKSKPPLTNVGFWSLTGYNTEQYLIANPLDRYALTDRSALTYPDGSLVYGTTSRNEGFQVLVQPADIVPPSNWTSNWLPAPAGGGSFSVTFRLYAPTTSLANGDWTYPVVEKREAIVA